MVKAPVLAYPDALAGYVLDTHASANGAGAMLSHSLEGQERVVARSRKTFSTCQQNYL